MDINEVLKKGFEVYDQVIQLEKDHKRDLAQYILDYYCSDGDGQYYYNKTFGNHHKKSRNIDLSDYFLPCIKYLNGNGTFSEYDYEKTYNNIFELPFITLLMEVEYIITQNPLAH